MLSFICFKGTTVGVFKHGCCWLLELSVCVHEAPRHCAFANFNSPNSMAMWSLISIVFSQKKARLWAPQSPNRTKKLRPSTEPMKDQRPCCKTCWSDAHSVPTVSLMRIYFNWLYAYILHRMTPSSMQIGLIRSRSSATKALTDQWDHSLLTPARVTTHSLPSGELKRSQRNTGSWVMWNKWMAHLLRKSCLTEVTLKC